MDDSQVEQDPARLPWRRSRDGEMSNQTQHLNGCTEGKDGPCPPCAERNRKKRFKSYLPKGRVLLVDDEDIIRRATGAALRLMGYDVAIAWDGEEAIGFYKTARESGNPFHVVIMDLTIRGGMGGREVIKRLLSIDAGANVILSTGYTDDPVVEHFKDHGFRGVIQKPYGVEDLEIALERSMAGAKED